MNCLLPVLMLILLLSGLVHTAFFPKEINPYENRCVNQLAPLTAQAWRNLAPLILCAVYIIRSSHNPFSYFRFSPASKNGAAAK